MPHTFSAITTQTGLPSWGADMDELIRKQETMEKLMAQNVIMDGSDYHNGFNAGVNRAQEVIRNLPPVQPKRGKWKDGKCDQCSGSAPFWPLANTYYCSNFCPHCGADMRGGSDGTD